MSDRNTLLQRMADQIHAWEQSGDRRTIFLACYALMTSNMFAALADDQFYDRVWVQELIGNFAEYYFVALDAYEHQTQPLALVWQQTHDLARNETTTAIQNLLMGVNAHINHDLVLVLDDMLLPEWGGLSAEQRVLRYRDYCTVNTVIGATIDTVQDQVVAPYARLMGIVDQVCGPLDEWCTARLLRGWRKDVWQQAITIIDTPDPMVRAELRVQTDTLARQRIQLLLSGGELGARVFGFPLRWLQRLRLI